MQWLTEQLACFHGNANVLLRNHERRVRPQLARESGVAFDCLNVPITRDHFHLEETLNVLFAVNRHAVWLQTVEDGGGPSPMVCGLAAVTGFDAVWVDIKHRDFSYRDVAAMVMAICERGADALVRPRRSGPDGLYRFLELGSSGLVVPHCMGAAHAREIARHTRFAPVGLRGMETVCVDADYMTTDALEYMQFVNRETFITVQIEDREAAEEVQAIAAVEKIDGLFLGPADLTQSYGIPLQSEHPKITDAIQRIADAAHAHGKIFATTTGSVEDAQRFIQMGARLINVGSDIALLYHGWRNIRREIEQFTREAEV